MWGNTNIKIYLFTFYVGIKSRMELVWHPHFFLLSTQKNNQSIDYTILVTILQWVPVSHQARYSNSSTGP